MAYLVLVFAALSYAVGIVAQSVAARRAERREGVDVGLLGRLARDRVFLIGLAGQAAGFVLAFFARAHLPLFLVQACTSSAVGLAAVMGALLLGWRVRFVEIGILLVMALGVVLLVGAAQPGPAIPLSPWTSFGLLGALLLVLVVAIPVSRLRGVYGAVPLGLLAGVSFAVLAIASRPLATRPLLTLPLEPTAWLTVAAAGIGLGLQAAALQRASATASMASMNALTVLLASGVGLLVLGDQVSPARGGWLLAGLALVVGGVLAMAAVSRRGAETMSAEPMPNVPVRIPSTSEEA